MEEVGSLIVFWIVECCPCKLITSSYSVTALIYCTEYTSMMSLATVLHLKQHPDGVDPGMSCRCGMSNMCAKGGLLAFR